MEPASSLESINKLACTVAALWGGSTVKVIFEFGSRYGEDSIEFAKKYPQATVYAFECNTNTLAECRKNISAYKNIILTEKAISDVNGTVSFYKIDKEKTETTWADGNQGASSLLKASGKYPVENYVQEEIKVDSITLSSFINANHIDTVDILWMDIQGAELLALKGLGDDIAKVKLMHLEVEFFEIYTNQPLFDEISAFLNDAGFELLGFSSQSNYSGDAIFVNKQQVPSAKLAQYKKSLVPKSPGIISRGLNKLKRITKKLFNAGR